MARLLTTGAEEANPFALFSYFDSIDSFSQDVLVTSPNELFTIGPRTGRGQFMLLDTQNLGQEFNADTTHTEMYFGFAIRTPILATSTILTMSTDSPGTYTNYAQIRILASGAVEFMRVTTSLATSVAGVIAINTWHYIEVRYKPLNSNGICQVKVDGVQVINYTGDTTNDLELINRWSLRGMATGTANPKMAFDDIVVNDTNGATNNSWPGMVRLLPIRPRATGTYSQWDRAGVNLGSDAAQVLSNNGFGFSLLQTGTADEKVTFTTEIPDLPAGATIQQITLRVGGRVEAGAGVIAPILISGATEDVAADTTLLSTWSYADQIYLVNPADSAAWEEADLATLEIGVSS